MRRDLGRGIIGQRKVNRAMFQQNGGCVTAQRFRAEPLDAYREFLEAPNKGGASVMHVLLLDRAAVAFALPPWEQIEP